MIHEPEPLIPAAYQGLNPNIQKKRTSTVSLIPNLWEEGGRAQRKTEKHAKIFYK